MGSEAYCTLLYNDSYLPGALVLGHALRDSNTLKQLAILVGPEVSSKAKDRLENVYDAVIPTTTIATSSKDAPQFKLLDRPDLDRSYTKINVWRLVQYSKVVFLDADTLPTRNIDELFDDNVTPLSTSVPVAGAPDIGWPDIFNSGVVALLPSNETFEVLARRARAGLSFDGGDQGLLNQFFENKWHRLPFTFNVTPSTSYQYTPAYQHFRENVAVIHYIGQTKPWTHALSGPFQSSSEFETRWWGIYNKYYDGNLNLKKQETADVWDGGDYGNHDDSESYQGNEGNDGVPLVESVYNANSSEKEAGSIGHTFEPDVMRWDATRYLPPMNSKPEAINLQETHYKNVWDNPAGEDPAYVQYTGYMKSNLHYNPHPVHDEKAEPPHQPIHHEGHNCHHHDHGHDHNNERGGHTEHNEQHQHDSPQQYQQQEPVQEEKAEQQEEVHVEPPKAIFPWEENKERVVERVFPEDYGYEEVKSEFELAEESTRDEVVEEVEEEEEKKEQQPQEEKEEEEEEEEETSEIPGVGYKPVKATRVFRDYSIQPSDDTAAFEEGFQVRQRNVWDLDYSIQKYVTTSSKTAKQQEQHEARQLAIKKYESSVKTDNQDYDQDKEAEKESGQDKAIEEYIQEEEEEVEKNAMIHGKIMKENEDGVILKSRGHEFDQGQAGAAPMYIPITPNPIKLRAGGFDGGLSDEEGFDDRDDDGDDDDEDKRMEEFEKLAEILKKKCRLGDE